MPQADPADQQQPRRLGYVRFPLGDRALLTLMVATDALFVDRDLDGNLAEESPIAWMGSPGRQYRNVHLEVPFLGAKDPAPVQVLVVFLSDAKPPRVEVTARAYRVGRVTLAGRVRGVRLFDHDGDLRFDKPAEDRLLVDLNGDGIFNDGELRAGTPFRLKGRGFVAVVPEASGRRVVFREVEEVPAPSKRPWPVLRGRSGGATAYGRGDLTKLSAALESKHWYARAGAVRNIGALGTEAAFDVLWKVYRNGRQRPGPHRGGALDGLCAVRAVLGPCLEDSPWGRGDDKLRRAAIDALHGMAAADREADVCQAAVPGQGREHVRRVGPVPGVTSRRRNARKKLLEAAERHTKHALRYHAYVSGTRYFAEPPSAALMRTAARAADQRLMALALRDMRYFDVPETRILALAATKERVWSNALAMALTEILAAEGDGEAVKAILPLADHESKTLQARLLDMLRPVRDPGGITAMVRALGAPSPSVRTLCANVLAEYETEETGAGVGAAAPARTQSRRRGVHRQGVGRARECRRHRRGRATARTRRPGPPRDPARARGHRHGRTRRGGILSGQAHVVALRGNACSRSAPRRARGQSAWSPASWTTSGTSSGRCATRRCRRCAAFAFAMRSSRSSAG